MIVALDAMGGDFAPVETVKGAVLALDEIKSLEIILVGDEKLIKEELKKYSYDKKRIKIEHTTEFIKMKEESSPAMAVRKKKKASMNISLELVKEGKANASVSAGNTGALMSASLLKLKRIKGVLRPAITTIMPSKRGNIVLMDVGANANCKPEYLEQFAIMGSYYAKLFLKKDNPKIGLINIGEETGKGNELAVASYELLEKNKKINFVGNIEPRDIVDTDIDVAVTDGFTGNVILKTAEGVGSFITGILKDEIKKSFMAKLGAIFLKNVFKTLKSKMDSSEYGGAIFLGVDGISIKAHGNSNSTAIKNAIKVANFFAEANFIENLKENF
ncbi:phosphate acyltransferase PlsX [Haliovirga abyssi]|uniref:Phosphate acyltransferase n=1 Tax=Haliovirga abyssi TaxID=2996794 RepID=A0AAU9DG27_9FUSO|nr:phosphate acyltransferase PlsX [Haliovirga abyssi]BDU50377.1 phosphate acyltransferase [Haliovirga abyssi]